MTGSEWPKPGLSPLFEVEAALEQITSVGATPAGEIRLVPIMSGSIEGERLRGKILPGGSDWQDLRSDGVLEISARYLIETDHAEHVEVRSVGLRAAPPEVLVRMAQGEIVPASLYYFRTAIRFRTAAVRLAWLNNLLAVAYGERRPLSVHLHVYEVL